MFSQLLKIELAFLISKFWKNSLLEQRFPTFSIHGTHKLIMKVLRHTKKRYIYIFFADLTKNRCNFDSATLDSYCCVGYSHFFGQSNGKEVSAPDCRVGYCMFKNPCSTQLEMAVLESFEDFTWARANNCSFYTWKTLLRGHVPLLSRSRCTWLRYVITQRFSGVPVGIAQVTYVSEMHTTTIERGGSAKLKNWNSLIDVHEKHTLESRKVNECDTVQATCPPSGHQLTSATKTKLL